jgi:hypothetical protein
MKFSSLNQDFTFIIDDQAEVDRALREIARDCDNIRHSRKVYISHPLRGDIDPKKPDISRIAKNQNEVDQICRHIAEDYPHILPLSPINAFSFLGVLKDDETALDMCLKLLELADELWVYGDWDTSEGCRMEIERARELNLPILFDEQSN